jgi:hypothetical protein
LSKVYREVYLRSPQVIKGHEQADTKADINASVLKKSGDSIIIDFCNKKFFNSNNELRNFFLLDYQVFSCAIIRFFLHKPKS